MSEALIDRHRRHIGRMKNGFWFAHRKFGSRARVHYGSPSALPGELGRFDIAVLGNVLLHCRDPLGILAQCAALTDGEIVVTDAKLFDSEQPIAYLFPSAENACYDTWWCFSPVFFVRMFGILGFYRTDVSYHEQLCVPPKEMRAMFTCVGKRVAPAAA